LQLQPALFPIKVKEEKVKSCCIKKDKKAPKECSEDGCCDKSMCNPFFTLCPLCAANGITVKKIVVSYNQSAYFIRQIFFSKDSHLIGQYEADILRPPQIV